MSDEALAACRFPALSEHYDAALRDAVAFILARYDVLGIVASGSIVRGIPDASSDLDVYVIQRPAWRQRVQRRFHGVPAELFVNPPQQVPRYFAAERRAGRPITAHMLATGAVILARDPVIDALIAQARDEWARPPALSDADRTFQRYMIASKIEDAADVATLDPQGASLILARAVTAMLHYVFLAAGCWVPRDKDLLAELHVLDAPLARCARSFFAAADAPSRIPLAQRMAEHVLGAVGFFEWESAPEAVALNSSVPESASEQGDGRGFWL